MHATRKLHDHADCSRHQRGIKDLRADVRVVANELELGRPADASCRFFGLAVPNGETKFRISGAGAHLVMRVHVDTGIETQYDLRRAVLSPEPRSRAG